MNKKVKAVSIITALLSTAAFAQVKDQDEKKPFISADVKGVAQTRYFQVSDQKKLAQYNLTLLASVDVNGFVTVHSMVQSGNGYNVGFNNIYNAGTNEFNKDHNLYLKRLYLERSFMNGDLNIQAGSMGTRKSIANTNKLSNIGWIDGSRAQLKTKLGDVIVTAGQIKPQEASMVRRLSNPELNYFEIAVSSKVMDKLLMEAGVEVYDGKTFIELATNYDIEIASGRLLKLMGDAKVQADNGAFKVGAGVKDIISLIRGKDTAVKLSVNYEYVKHDFSPGMNALANGMHTGYTGSAVVFKSSFPISKKYGISGFTNLRVGSSMQDTRIEVGIKKTLWNKQEKKKKKK